MNVPELRTGSSQGWKCDVVSDCLEFPLNHARLHALIMKIAPDLS